MGKPRISYVDPATVKDRAMIAEFERCAREGTPRPESQAVRAHVPAVFWSFANSWRDVFKNGVADHDIKELCRVYVSRSVKCEFCGNQRSMKAASQGLVEDDYRDLINFESSTHYDERQKAALSYAEAITWDLPVDDAFWARLHKHFSEPELVEIGYFIALTMGQQRWLRTLDIDHHQIMAGTDASMAPGFEDAKACNTVEGERRLLGAPQRRGGENALPNSQTVAKPRGTACIGSMPVSVMRTISPVCTPALPSGVTTLGWMTTTMPARNGSSGTCALGRLFEPRIGGR